MNKSTLIVASVAGLIAGGGGSVLLDILAADSAPRVIPTLENLDADKEDLAAMRHIQDALAVMSERIAKLEIRSPQLPNREPAEAASSSELTADLEELRDLLASFQSIDKAPPARFQNLVELAIESKEDRERAERDERRRVEREQRMDRQVADLTDKLGLDPNQSSQMRDILTNRDLDRDEFFRGMREGDSGMDRSSIRDTMREWTESYNTKIQGVLNPQQFKEYEEMNTGRRGWGGFDGRESSGRGGRGGF